MASACGDGEPNLELDAAPAESVAIAEAPASSEAEETASADEPSADDDASATDEVEEAPAETTTTTIAPPPPPGREVLASLQEAGEPYVLWFWGAH